MSVWCCPSLVYICFPEIIECWVQPIIVQALNRLDGGHPLTDCFDQSTSIRNILSHFMSGDPFQGYINLYSAEMGNNFGNICRLVNPLLLAQDEFCTGFKSNVIPFQSSKSKVHR